MVNIEVNDKQYKVSLAISEEDKETGLQGVSELPAGEGMLFVYDEPQTVGFWMQDTLIDLDIIYIDEYGEVLKVFKGEAGSEKVFQADDVKYVLELNVDSGVKVGDDVDLSEVEDEVEEDEDEDDAPTEEEVKMLVLDAKGKTQMELKGGERIFSRVNTKTLVRLAKRAYKSKLDKDYKALGRKVFQYLETQNNKEEDYVEIPEK